MQHVRAEPIDGLISAGLILPPDIMLIDVDGGEIPALRGAAHALQFCRVVIVEVAEDTANDVDGILNFAGFTMTAERKQRRGNRIYVRA